jgi:alpha-tubulin suppressor-like RCC1 family protein
LVCCLFALALPEKRMLPSTPNPTGGIMVSRMLLVLWVMLSLLILGRVAAAPGAAQAQTPADSAAAPVIKAIAAGHEHTCALTAAGGVKCWGNNTAGQLGDGTTENRLTPVDVVGLDSGVQALAAGESHTCALTTAGAVKCWGANYIGQLGIGTWSHEPETTPVDVIGMSSNIKALAAGRAHTCALTMAGGVKCWGSNIVGQLGDGTTETRLTPVGVTGLGSDIKAIAAGYGHTCAMTTAGGVKCWGGNEFGQLGDNSVETRLTPVGVAGLGSGVQALAAGMYHTCAITAAGGVKCWGSNDQGQLGNGGSGTSCGYEWPCRLTPVDVVGLDSGVQAIAAGEVHTCALTVAGGVKCWGNNENGKLGMGMPDNPMDYHYYHSTPQDVLGLSAGVQALAAGGTHTCALTTAGGVKCWGANDSGQLGVIMLVDVAGLDSGVQALAASNGHTCAVTAAGGVKCWGHNDQGQLGDRSVQFRLTPVDVIGLSSDVQAIAAGDGHTCALTTAGGVQCWGGNYLGQLGVDNGGVLSFDPLSVEGLDSGVQALAAGGAHTCALTTAGGVKCWGNNYYGQLGDGGGGTPCASGSLCRLTPVGVAGLDSGVKAIAAGMYHTCAVTAAGGVKCWGYNDQGQLGGGTVGRMPQVRPVNVAQLSDPVQVLAAGQRHTCALTTAGGVKCWGGYDLLGRGKQAGREWSFPFHAGPVDVAWTETPAPLSQTITFAPLPDRLLPTAVLTMTITVQATASSGLPVTFSSTTPGVCSVTYRLAGAIEIRRGTCTLVASQPGVTGGYAAAPDVQRSFEVRTQSSGAKLSQTITFAPLSDHRLDESSVPLSAIASSGLVVYFRTITPDICIVEGATARLLTPGDCTIAAFQPGNAQYDPAQEVQRSFEVRRQSSGSKSSQTITFAPLPNRRLDAGPFVLDATASSGLAVSFTATTPDVCTVDGVTVNLIAPGTCTILAAQAGDELYDPAPSVRQTFQVYLESPPPSDFFLPHVQR